MYGLITIKYSQQGLEYFLLLYYTISMYYCKKGGCTCTPLHPPPLPTGLGNALHIATPSFAPCSVLQTVYLDYIDYRKPAMVKADVVIADEREVKLVEREKISGSR